MAEAANDSDSGDEKMLDDEEDSSASSSSSEFGSSEEVNDEQLAASIAELEEKVQTTPFQYDFHVNLIGLLRKAADLTKLREARDRMRQLFPLSQELWIDWLQDEVKMAHSVSEKEETIKLFEMAVQDYLSVAVWLEYVQFAIGLMGEEGGIERVRSVFEKALTSCGLHVTQGVSIWEAYREFEMAIYMGLMAQAIGADAAVQDRDSANRQKEKVKSLFKRQLRVPLYDMNGTFEEYKEFVAECNEPVDKNIEHQYKKAFDQLNQRKDFEAALMTSDPPHLEEYRSYLAFEKKHGDPARVQCLFERAIQENCLAGDLWLQYLEYLDSDLKIANIVLTVYERAVRNCPWTVAIWQRYMVALERTEAEDSKVQDVFNRALNSGLTQAADYVTTWLIYIDYLRRRISWDGEDEADRRLRTDAVRNAFAKAHEQLTEFFGDKADPSAQVVKYWAFFEAFYCKRMDEARKLWNEKIMQLGHGREASFWLEFYQFERVFGDENHCRKVLLKGVHTASDFPEMIVEELKNFERYYGTLESYDSSMEKCEAQMERVRERREKAAGKELQAAKKQGKPAAAKPGQQKPVAPKQKGAAAAPSAQNQKRLTAVLQQHTQSVEKANQRKAPAGRMEEQENGSGASAAAPGPDEASVVDSEGFKVPGFCAPKKAPKRAANDTEQDDGEGADKRRAWEPEVKKPRVDEAVRNQQTVFVSNLAFSTDEEQVKAAFHRASISGLVEVRLVGKRGNRSRGYGYVEFDNEASAMQALSIDRTMVEGRPMFVSVCRPDGEREKVFHFSTELEKSKLFISNLPFTITKEALNTIFEPYGPLKDVRMVTYRNGKPKGLAYVEYATEEAAQQAILKCNGLLIGDREIAVAISNPPKRKEPGFRKDDDETPEMRMYLGASVEELGPRGRGRSQVQLLPRSLSVKATPALAAGQTAQPAKMSNDDFRKMLLK